MRSLICALQWIPFCPLKRSAWISLALITRLRISALGSPCAAFEMSLKGTGVISHSGTDGGGGFRPSRGGKLLVADARHADVDVDAVEQGTRDFVHVALYLSWGADTVVGWIAIIAAGTRVHACHKHERTRIVDGVFGAADVDVPVFQRLAQHLEGRLVELGQLVAEEHAIVCNEISPG